MKTAIGVLFVGSLGLLACLPNSEPRGLLLTVGSYGASPAILLDTRINGAPVLPHHTLVSTSADVETPRSSSYHRLDYTPNVEPGRITVSITWVEIFTAKAWHATVSASVRSLVYQASTDTIRIAPIFGPNGLLLITSDPIPTSAAHIPLVDVARICGTRRPDLDFDFTANPTEIARLPELLAFNARPVTSPECPAQD